MTTTRCRSWSTFLVSVGTVSAVGQKYTVTGNVVRAPSYRQGRPSNLSAEVRADLAELLRDDPTMYLDELVDWLAIVHDCPIAVGTLCDIIKDMDLRWKRLSRTASERDEERRDEFMARMQRDYTINQLVFGEKMNTPSIAINYGRAPSGQRAIQAQPFVQGAQWTILPVMNQEGYLAVRFVEGSVNSEEFLDFIIEDVLPRMNPFPGPNSVLVLDNCAIHHSRAVRTMVEDSGCRLEFSIRLTRNLDVRNCSSKAFD